jgi:hypothetical protein
MDLKHVILPIVPSDIDDAFRYSRASVLKSPDLIT